METVEVLPNELDKNPTNVAMIRLKEQLSKKNNIQNIKSYKQRDLPEVARGRGSLYFYFDVEAHVFDPQEGQIIQARLADVVQLGVVLMANNMRCIIPETLFRNDNTTNVDFKLKTLSLGNKTYTLGSTITIKLLKIRKIERDGFQEREAIANLVGEQTN